MNSIASAFSRPASGTMGPSAPGPAQYRPPFPPPYGQPDGGRGMSQGGPHPGLWPFFGGLQRTGYPAQDSGPRGPWSQMAPSATPDGVRRF